MRINVISVTLTMAYYWCQRGCFGNFYWKCWVWFSKWKIIECMTVLWSETCWPDWNELTGRLCNLSNYSLQPCWVEKHLRMGRFRQETGVWRDGKHGLTEIKEAKMGKRTRQCFSNARFRFDLHLREFSLHCCHVIDWLNNFRNFMMELGHWCSH